MKHFSLHLFNGTVAFAAAILLATVSLRFFEPYVLFLSGSVLQKISAPVLFFLVALNDFIITPISPDIAIFLIAQKSAGNYPLIVALGIASVLGGAAAWGAGRYLESKFKLQAAEKFMAEHPDLINRYGVWVVALGALTPVPYSLTCWVAGALKMDFSKFFPMLLFRIPRFLIYFHFFTMSNSLAKTVLYK